VNILSLFNGISGLHLACDRAGLKVDNCYYSEIDKYANQVTEKQYPNDVALGNVTKWREWNIDWSSIDLVGAGFPCQAWSVAGQQQGDKDERGMLFWTTLEIIKHVLYFNPKAKFLMENVKMKKDFEEYITHHTTQALGYVEKTLINSALVSAQNRNRYYWTNFEVTQPRDKGVLLKDIIDGTCINLYKGLEKDIRNGDVVSEQNLNGISQTMQRALNNGRNPDQKANSLTACSYKGMGTNGMTNVLINESATKTGKAYSLTAPYSGAVAWNSCERKQRTMIPVQESSSVEPNIHNGVLYRKLTPLECERLQTLPDNWTDCISNTQRYKSIGNGWTIDVIAHILGCM
jgi:DNA-cytosine methyltransferase